ncbi:MAG: fumarylacetoacetate hydrolase family protein [Pseudomonadota bacterium]
MRLVTFRHKGIDSPGLLIDDDRVLDIRKALSDGGPDGSGPFNGQAPANLLDIIIGGPSALQVIRDCAADTGRTGGAVLPLTAVTLLAPIPRPLKNVFCVGSNYRAHVTEASRAQAKEDKTPEHPVFFTKPPTSVVGPDAIIEFDPHISEKIDYEVELGVIIGKAGRDIPAARAIDHIFGFTIINDITARDLQRRHGGQFLKGKGLDTSCPMGPEIVTLDALPNFEDLRISAQVNGEARQDGNTGDMIFPVARLIESLSEGMTLEPGDLLATGTPSGVGYAMTPPNFLGHDDVVTCEIEGIGKLENTVRDRTRAVSAA